MIRIAIRPIVPEAGFGDEDDRRAPSNRGDTGAGPPYRDDRRRAQRDGGDDRHDWSARQVDRDDDPEIERELRRGSERGVRPTRHVAAPCTRAKAA